MTESRNEIDAPPGRPVSTPSAPAIGLRRQTLARTLLVAGPFLLLVVGGVQVLSGGPFARGVEAAFLRARASLRGGKAAAPSPHIVLVTIDEDDFRDAARFNGTTPLASGPLAELADAIALGRPAAVAVALDTSSRTYRGLTSPPAVSFLWAQDAEPLGGDRFRAYPVLGRPPDEGPPPSGILAFFPEADGAVWRLRRRFEPLSRDALGWAVLKAYCKGRESRECRGRNIDARRDLVLDFTAERPAFTRVSAGEILRAAQTPEGQADGKLEDKIVILGPRYRAARDEVVTPLGGISRAELLALAVESDLKGGGVRSAPRDLVIAVEVVLGLALILLFHFFSLDVAAAIGLFVLPASLGVSWGFGYPWASSFAGGFWVVVLTGVQQLLAQARLYKNRSMRLSGAFRSRR